MKILIAYDGSPDAKAATKVAGSLFDGTPTVVLSVWEGLSQVTARASAGLASAFDFEQIDAECEQAARRRAKEGTAHARVAGLPAEARVAHRNGTVWQTIVAEAHRANADMIVLGTRGLSGVTSLLLGSVSRAVLQHADCPVLVVPAPASQTAAGLAHHHDQRHHVAGNPVFYAAEL